MKQYHTSAALELDNCPLCGARNHVVYLNTKDYFFSCEDFSIHKCGNCGHLFTNPQPSADSIINYYKSERYLSHKEQAESLVEKIYSGVRWLNLRTKYKQISRGIPIGRLLDYGCGRGDFLRFASMKGWESHGIERDEDARKFAAKLTEVNVYENHESLTHLQKSFDVITMFHVLEHIPNLHSTFSALNDLLKDNGRLALALPNPLSFDAQHYGRYWAAWDVPRHLHHFSRETIVRLAGQYGFRLNAIYPMYWDAFFVSMLSEEYMQSKLRTLKSGLVGLLSNAKGIKSKQFSSLLYILTKQT